MNAQKRLKEIAEKLDTMMLDLMHELEADCQDQAWGQIEDFSTELEKRFRRQIKLLEIKQRANQD